MKSIKLKNGTAAELILIIEPIAEEYVLSPGDQVELSGSLYLDSNKILEMEITNGAIVLYVPEEACITRNGEQISPERLSRF